MAQDSTLKFLVAAQVTGQEQIARLINDTDRLNKTTKGLQTAFSQMGGAAKSLSDVQKNAAAIDAARAEKLARLSQEFYNNALSIDRTAKSARDSAAAFEEAFQAQEMVAKAQRDAAAAAADLRAKLDPMIPIQNRFNAEMDHAADLLRMGAISQKEYAAATTMARQNLYSAQQALHGMNAAQTGVIINGVRYNSMADAQAKALRQQRQGTQMLGMQFNDLATSISTGASPITAFNQQIGQVGIAMADMGGKMGAVGRFLIGPWGTALTIATMALGFLAEKFLFSGEEAKKTESKISDLSDQFDVAKLSAEDLDRVNELLVKSNKNVAQTAIQAANATARQSAAYANNTEKVLENAKTKLENLRAELTRLRLSEQYTGRSLEQGMFSIGLTKGNIATAEAEVAKLEASLNGFKTRARAARAEEYSLTSALDDGGRATEKHNAATNNLINDFKAGKITWDQYTNGIKAANAELARSEKLSERSGGRSGGRGKKVESFANVNFLERDAAFLKASLDKGTKYWQDYYNNIELTSVSVLQQIADDHEMVTATIQTVGDTAGPVFLDRFQEVQTAFQSIGNSVASAFQGMLTGAMSWKDGMKGIIQSVINELWRLFIVQKIVGFVTNTLTGAGYGGGGAMGGQTFFGAASDIGNKLSSSTQFFMGTMGKNANGTQNWRGGLSLVGERGPEIVNLPRGSQVIPAHRAQNMMGGGVTVNVDARGSADPAAVRAQVQAGIMQAAPAIIAAAEARTVAGLRRPRLGGVMQ